MSGPICQCGCKMPAGYRTGAVDTGKPRRFRNGHGRHTPGTLLGVTYDAGRWKIQCRDGSWEYFYRAVVMAHLGRELELGEHVHHVNGDSADDRIENLEVLGESEHCTLHARASRLQGRWAYAHDECRGCRTTASRHEAHGLCRRCYVEMWRAAR